MRNLWERLQSAKRRESGIGRPYTSYDDMMVWAREQQAEVEVETCSAGAQHIEPSPEGGGSGRDDGIARPGHGWPNQSPSEDRATGHDDEIVGRYEETLEEGESAAAAAAPTMTPGASSREGNRGKRYSTRARAGDTAITTAPAREWGLRARRWDRASKPEKAKQVSVRGSSNRTRQ